MPLRFTVLSDRKEVFTTTVGLGRTRPVKGGHQRLDPGVAAGQHHQRGAVPRRQPRRLYRAAGAPVSAGPSTPYWWGRRPRVPGACWRRPVAGGRAPTDRSRARLSGSWWRMSNPVVGGRAPTGHRAGAQWAGRG